jgi:hypothetical protein
MRFFYEELHVENAKHHVNHDKLCVKSEGEDERVQEEDACNQQRKVYARDWQHEYIKKKAQDYAKE